MVGSVWTAYGHGIHHVRMPPSGTEHRLAELEWFVDARGCMPHTMSDYAEERQLAYWVKGVVDFTDQVDHDTAVRVFELVDTMPARRIGWSDYRLAELEEFVERNGRFPSRDGLIARATNEYSLALWEMSVRRGVANVSDEVAAAVATIAVRYGRKAGRRAGQRGQAAARLEEPGDG